MPATMDRTALLEQLRVVLADVDERDREERRRRVRSHYGLKPDSPVHDDLLDPGRLTSYQIMVQTGEHHALQRRAAACVLLQKFLADPDVNRILEGEDNG